MADNVVRSTQDFSGRYQSDGPQFVGSTINTAGGSIYLDSMSDAVVVPSLVCRLSYCTGSAKHDHDSLLELLSPAAQAAFNASNKQHEPLCLPDTRIDVLRQITIWAEGSHEKCIFWLNGMAGTGKSTIARTIARKYYELGYLGASFFFSRGSGDLSHTGKFFTSIAVQLANRSPALKGYICEAIAEHRDIASQTLRDQWNQLIFKPLSRLEGKSLQPPLVLAVDALDECEGDDEIRSILQLFAEAKSLSNIRIRIFITSRPETPIRTGFRKTEHQHLILHEIHQPIIDNDISIFFKYKLGEISEDFDDLPSDWPGDDIINLLVQRAGGLFIYAATIYRFIRSNDQWSPPDLLALFIPGDSITDSSIPELSDRPNKSPTLELDKMYLQVIKHPLRKVNDERDMAQLTMTFRQIVGSIVILSETLSATTLASLLAVKKEKVYLRLRYLRSILDVPEDAMSPIRLLHPSFRDFLLDKQRCQDQQFWVDEKEAHRILAVSCLRLMSEHLKRDICGLHSPGALATEVHGDQIAKCLPKELQYACRYWVEHLRRSEVRLGDQVHHFLRKHFLHWLEALALLRKISDGAVMLSALESLLTVSDWFY